MDTFLLLLALLTSAVDTGVSCHLLAQRYPSGAPRYKEVSPLLPQSCAGIAAIRAAVLTSAILLPQPWKRVSLAGIAISGGIGLTLTLTLKDDEE